MSPAARELLTPHELAATDVGDAQGGVDGLVRALLYALDDRDELLARQRAMLARLAPRTWADVAADMLRLAPPGCDLRG